MLEDIVQLLALRPIKKRQFIERLKRRSLINSIFSDLKRKIKNLTLDNDSFESLYEILLTINAFNSLLVSKKLLDVRHSSFDNINVRMNLLDDVIICSDIFLSLNDTYHNKIITIRYRIANFKDVLYMYEKPYDNKHNSDYMSSYRTVLLRDLKYAFNVYFEYLKKYFKEELL